MRTAGIRFFRRRWAGKVVVLDGTLHFPEVHNTR